MRLSEILGEAPPDPTWTDWVAVERAVRGEPVGRALTRAEKGDVAHHLTRAGWTVNAIAEHLGVQTTMVRRWLTEAAA